MWLKKLLYSLFFVNFWYICDQKILHFLNNHNAKSSTPSSQSSSDKRVDPEATMTAEEVIQYHGYPLETYDIQTTDGFIITIQRILHGKDGDNDKVRVPVLLQHGIFCSSAIWIINPPESNLPYLLADAGYDVWLGNVRGTKYGNKHTKYSPSDYKFWEFSIDDMAKYDIPAIIDKILMETEHAQIYYIGYSMGTSIAFAMLSSQPQYNKIIKEVLALAPVSNLQHARGLGQLLVVPLVTQFKTILYTQSKPVVALEKLMANFFRHSTCSGKNGICLNLIFGMCGFDDSQYNETRGPVFFHHFPELASMRNLIHYTQLSHTSRFQQLDHGPNGNLEKYGQKTPPLYDLKRITTPVAVFWAENDFLADPRDVKLLEKQLDSLVLSYKVPYKKFSHMDFVWAKDVKTLLYDKILEEMSKNMNT